QALIHNPSVLILDEPTTGLDPNQLEEIRRLIREISREKTVILSSHIMQEVEAVCNRVLIINKGKIVADGGIAEIKSAGLKRRQVVRVEFNAPVLEVNLRKIQGIEKVTKEGDFWQIEAKSEADIRPVLFEFAVNNKLTLLTLQEQQHNLENIFYQLTRTNES
ncbi:MAG TPA: AAA family ATPase, partial [Prolixibacteraceae bacterium]|nr:AAA family ATPase [Prolixibacteraceae bacterium]